MSNTDIKITLRPMGRSVQVQSGMTLLEVGARGGVVINTPCGGAGKCGKCRVRFEANAPAPTASEVMRISQNDLDDGWRLACQVRLVSDAVLHIPASSVFGGYHQIQADSVTAYSGTLDSAIQKFSLEMTSPAMNDDMPDLARIEHAVARVHPHWNADTEVLTASFPLLQLLGDRLRTTGFKGTAIVRDNQLIGFEDADTDHPLLALAFDIGTTTLVGALLDMETGDDRAVLSAMNPQTAFGDDVLSRIAYGSRDAASLTEIRNCLLDAVNDIIERLCNQAGVSTSMIYSAVFTGNTTMQHLLCGFNPAPLGVVPFVPLCKHGVTVEADVFGLTLHPQALVYVFPVIGGFVGGDTVAGLLACDIARQETPVLVIDIGTNGEIVLAHGNNFCAASTAAGPAFEGARISCGMRAATGAVEKVVAGEDLVFSVIGGADPLGLCGSGLIDLCAELLRIGALRADGRLLVGEELPPEVPETICNRMRIADNGEPECVLYESGSKEALTLTQRDVRELQLGAGAIRAGISILLKQAGVTAGDLKQVLIAGGFGSFIRRDSAQRIGLIPEELNHEKIRFVGNVAFSGAKWAALSRQARRNAEHLANAISHVELNQDPDFALEFAMAMQFPVL